MRGAFERLCAQDNVRLAPAGDLHDLLSRAEYQVGVCSSALLEGTELGCRTLLVPLPGIEHMAHLLESGKAELLDDFLASAGQVTL